MGRPIASIETAPVRARGRQPQAALCRLSVTDRGTITDRGEHLESWWIRIGDAWVRATEHPAATVEVESDSETADDNCPSGTIWQRTTELVVERGTRVLQRQSWPRVRNLSVMEYLKLGLDRPGRVVRQREFIVTGNYRLRTISDPHGRQLAQRRASAK